MGHLLRNGLHVELEPGVSGSGLALKPVQDSSEAAHAGHAASCLASIVRLTLPHDDDHTATTTRTSVTGTGDNGAARQQGRASTSPPPLSLFLFPPSHPLVFFVSFFVSPALSLFSFLYSSQTHTHRALHGRTSTHTHDSFPAAVMVVLSNGGGALSAPALPTSGHGSSVRVALFLSFGVQPLRGSTRTGKPKEACHLEQAS